MSKKIAFHAKAGGTRVFTSDHERLIDDICRAIPAVEDAQYTQDKKPRVDAIELLLGEPIEEKDRDEAFKIYLIKKGAAASITEQPPEEQPADDSTTGEQNEAD